MNGVPTTPTPRWRTWCKVAVTIVVTLVAVPVALIMLFGSMQERR